MDNVGKYIIDVSKWNGKDFDYKSLPTDILGVIIKCGEKDFYDSLVDLHTSKAKAAGLKVGYYYFFRDNHDPEVQANKFADYVTKNSPDLSDLGLPSVWCDWETISIDKEKSNAAVISFMETYEKRTATIPGLYSYTSFLNTHISKKYGPTFQTYKLWIAQYSGAPKKFNKIVWAFDDNLYLHQFTDKYLGGVLDCSIILKTSLYSS
jgi:GH25 family lysozyme M1 (1,4-beta-N-acetylmuramidase)